MPFCTLIFFFYYYLWVLYINVWETCFYKFTETWQTVGICSLFWRDGQIPNELVDFTLTSLLRARRLSFLWKRFIDRSKVHGKHQTQITAALASSTTYWKFAHLYMKTFMHSNIWLSLHIILHVDSNYDIIKGNGIQRPDTLLNIKAKIWGGRWRNEVGQKSKSQMAKCFVCQPQGLKLSSNKTSWGEGKPWEACEP